jgi:hypothetical protein
MPIELIGSKNSYPLIAVSARPSDKDIADLEKERLEEQKNQKIEMGTAARRSEDRPSKLGFVAVFTSGVALLSIVILSIFSQGKSTDASRPQSSVNAGRTAVINPPPQAPNKLSPSPNDIKAAQNRLIELGYLAGPADGVWGTKSRMALRAFKIANALAADDKWDDVVSGRLYSAQAARSPLPLATTGR